MLNFLIGIIILFAPFIIRWSPVVSIFMLLCILMGAKWVILPFIVSNAIWIAALILKKKL